MVAPQTQQKQKTETHNGPGRPPKGTVTPEQARSAATAALVHATDRANNFIHDGGPSMARRVRACARAGVPRETVEKVVATVEAALTDLRGAVKRAYEAPAQKAAPKSRVQLA